MMKKKINALCLSGFIVSLVSLLINLFGIVGMVGFVLSIVGLCTMNATKETGEGMAITGIAVGGFSIIYAFLILLSI